MPNGGQFLGALLHGRAELLALLRRRRYGEILMRDLAALTLKKSALPPTFVAKDLVGHDLVALVNTSAGDLLRLVKAS